MDFLLRRERRRLANELINQQILEQTLDRRRQYYSIIHDSDRSQRHNRSYSHDSSDLYEEQIKHRSTSNLSHSRHRHPSNESKECSLITLTYSKTGADRHTDEITIVQRGKTVFKGCLKRGDQLTFKSKRYRTDPKLKLNIYINDILEDQLISCCEHALRKQNGKQLFQIERVVGSKPCRECQFPNESSSSSSLSSSSVEENSPRSTIVTNQQTSSTMTNHSSKSERKKKPTTSTSTQADVEKACSEGFPADISELADFQPVPTNQINNPPQTEDESTTFLPVLSSTDRESPPPPPPTTKRTYGPPQLSTMLSISEPTDSPFEQTPEIREETVENSENKKLKSINNQPKRDSDSEDNQNETRQFLSSMSSYVENTSNQPTPSISMNSSRGLAMADDATRSLLARLGIVRQQQTEHTEILSSSAPRERGNVENFVLVYLHEHSPENDVIKQFRSLVNFLKIFDDIDDCMAFINGIVNEKVLLISSNRFISLILPKIKDLQQILSIYILSNDDNDEQEDAYLINNSKLIRGLYRDITKLCEQMSIDIDLVIRDLISFITISLNSSEFQPTFVYNQLLSEIILDNEETDNSIKELICFARQEYQDNQDELAIIDEFENDYQKNRAIWWFTRPCFLSKMLNKGLSVPEADVLFKLRLFIQHLTEQIENESISDTSLTVYLGHTIHQNDLDDLQKASINNPTLLVFNQFLFGSTDLSNAIEIAKNLPCLNEEYLPVILHLNISSNFKCANTSSLRYSVDDRNDVLLNMGSIARLTRVDKDQQNEHGIPSIYLTLSKLENEDKLREYLKIKRNEVKGAAPFVTLIKLMLTMNQQARAEELIYMIFNDELLKSDPNLQGSLAASCHIVGASCHARGDFKRAVQFFHLSLDTFLRFVPSDAVQLSPTYNNIGSMYFRQEEYDKAEEYHQKALDVQIKSHNPNLNSIASYSNNVGVVHLKQGKFSQAAKSFERALKILQQINQPNDPDLASTYDNLGDAYLLQDKYDQALTFYSKALEIQRHIQPKNPQALASFNNSIGNVYNKMHRYGDALIHFKRSLECQLEYLPSTHPSFASLYNNIGSMYYRQEQYADALPCYLKSLEIELMCLPENHPTIAVTHFNIATTYTGLGRFEDAILSTERSIEQLLKTLPADHPEVAENRSYIETIKRKQMLKGLFDTNTTDS